MGLWFLAATNSANDFDYIFILQAVAVKSAARDDLAVYLYRYTTIKFEILQQLVDGFDIAKFGFFPVNG